MENDIQKSITDSLKERLSTPFWGALIFSWVSCNWKFVYLSFFVNGEKLDTTKLEIAKEYISLFQSVLLPIAFAILYLAVNPWINYWTQVYFLWIKNKLIYKQSRMSRKVDFMVALRDSYDDLKKLNAWNYFETFVKYLDVEASDSEIEEHIPVHVIKELETTNIIRRISTNKPGVGSYRYEFTSRGKHLRLHYDNDTQINKEGLSKSRKR